MVATEGSKERSRLAGQLEWAGIRDPRVLQAIALVPRERFVPADLVEFAYRDTPLPIGEDQTISQPYVVAAMVEALELKGHERVLEVGTGSGYAAAVLSHVAGEVYSIERNPTLAASASERLEAAGYGAIHLLEADGTLGWPEEAPFDAIVVAAGGPDIPAALRRQLAPGGRIVIPIGPTPRSQELICEHLRKDGSLERTNLGPVRFVPLVGAEGWRERPLVPPAPPSKRPSDRGAIQALREEAEPFLDIDQAEFGPLVERLSEARIVLMGEASHGTSEFYRVRAELTKALILRDRVRFVAVEGDWPDVARIDSYVRQRPEVCARWTPFSRFPLWMWQNREVADFVEWLRDHNQRLDPERRVGLFGLDLYSLHRSIDAVLDYLDRNDPAAAAVARLRYGCLSPWLTDPATYGQLAVTPGFRSCEIPVVDVLVDLFKHQLEHPIHAGFGLFDAIQNARLVANAERYYRSMYLGSSTSWNLRDSHMFETLEVLIDAVGDGASAVVWEHNSHVGDARATEMGARGELNVGQLCRERFGDDCRIVGFGTHRGTVAAAHDWGGAMEVMEIMPSQPGSYERVFHETGTPAFVVPLDRREDLTHELAVPRLERAIGVVYRPRTELSSHYFQAILPDQFDEYVWVDVSGAVQPIQLATALSKDW